MSDGTFYFENKREYSRVESHFPLEVRIVPAEEKPYVRSRTGRRLSPAAKLPQDLNDPLLTEWLKLINAKIDSLLSLLSMDQEKVAAAPCKGQNISGGGTSFTSPIEYSLGDLLEIKIDSPAAAIQPMYLYGPVVQSEKRSDEYFTAIEFIQLDEAVRDDIIRFVFEKEREILREKRRD